MILAETRHIGAQLVISDDRSSDPETLRLLQVAGNAGADVIHSPAVGGSDSRLDGAVHAGPRDAVRSLARSLEGAQLISRCAARGYGEDEVRRALLEMWNRQLHNAHLSAQRNFLFAMRHILSRYHDAGWLLNVDDDVVLRRGAFARMRATWALAEEDGHDVLAVSGIRTVNEQAALRRPAYTITIGMCNVAVLHRRSDLECFLASTPTAVALRKGCDLAFAWDYAQRYRPGAVAVAVTPSVVYHTGQNGLHVRDEDLNCEYAAETTDVLAP